MVLKLVRRFIFQYILYISFGFLGEGCILSYYQCKILKSSDYQLRDFSETVKGRSRWCTFLLSGEGLWV